MCYLNYVTQQKYAEIYKYVVATIHCVNEKQYYINVRCTYYSNSLKLTNKNLLMIQLNYAEKIAGWFRNNSFVNIES